jgi:hypothetical protein
MATNVTFIADGHVYLKEGGVRVTSVTQILESSGLVDYSHVPDGVLEHKAEIGTAAHAATHYFDEGRLNWSTVDDEVYGYVKAWEKFKNETDVEILADGIERRGIATMDGMEYAFTFDRDVMLNEKPSLLEIKCTAGIEISWGPQTAAYEHALRQQDGKARRRIAVHLKPTGLYSLIPLNDVKDYHIFRAALLLESWKKSRGKGYGYGSAHLTR